MESLFDVVIVGGGAGGLFGGVIAGKNGLKTLILEAQDKPGKKLLATGNGKCNLSNQHFSGWEYNSDIAKNVFSKCSVKSVLKDFNDMGVLTYADSEGRIYPQSNSSHSVLSALQNALNVLNVKVKNNSKVNKIEKTDFGFNVFVGEYKFATKNVLLATGGSACSLASDFGHTVTEFKPSLVGIKTKENLSSLAGTRVKARVKLTYGKTFLPEINGINSSSSLHEFSEMGEVLFRENGISGICVFNCSSIINRFKEIPKISLDLLPDLKCEEIVNLIKSYNEHELTKNNRILFGLLPESVAKFVLKKSVLPESIAEELKNFKLTFNGFLENNQVTSGGVSVNEIDETMQSKKTKGLFMCGETLDVDGICGGYNLQFAFCSAKLAISEIAKK